jgi:muramoyltetrapeptide carboxypeptidase
VPSTPLTPGPLRPGDNIRIISPAAPTMSYVPDRLARAEQSLRGLDFKPTYGENVYAVSADGSTAGSAEERAADLMEAFLDPSVAAVFCSDAGEGSADLIPHLDAGLIRANPKAFIGYSDNVYLNQYLLSQAGLVSYYGYTYLHHLGEPGGPFPETLQCFRDALMSPGELRCEPMPSRTSDWYSWIDPEEMDRVRLRATPGGVDWIRRGRAEGTLLGAALPLLPDLVANHGLELAGAVLFWDVNLYNEVPVRRLLSDLADCADLSALAGMVVGANQVTAAGPWAEEVAALLDDVLPGAGYPVLVNADLSHLCPSWLVPYGARVVLGETEGLLFPRTAEEGIRACESSI